MCRFRARSYRSHSAAVDERIEHEATPCVVAEGWHGLVVSSRTPPDHVRRQREALRLTQSDPAYLQKLQALGAMIRTDSAKWGAIIKAADIKFE